MIDDATIRSRIRPSGIVRMPPEPPALPADNPRCRCCLAPLEVCYQPGLAGSDGFRLFTCRNPRCRLHRFTFSEPDYASVDLRRYRAQQHPEYRR